MSKRETKVEEITELVGQTFSRVFQTKNDIPLHRLRCYWYDGTVAGNDFDPETEKFDYCAMEQCGNIPEDSVVFMGDGITVALGHEQSCCEYVRLESTDIPLDQLVGHKILSAEKRSIWKETDIGDRTDTWYFIEFEDIGTCTMRWCGTSNGYYSTAVETFVEDRRFYEKWWHNVS